MQIFYSIFDLDQLICLDSIFQLPVHACYPELLDALAISKINICNYICLQVCHINSVYQVTFVTGEQVIWILMPSLFVVVRNRKAVLPQVHFHLVMFHFLLYSAVSSYFILVLASPLVSSYNSLCTNCMFC